MKIKTTIFFIFIFNFSISQNDLCTNAITLTPTPTCITTQGTFSGSSISTSAPSCASNASQDVWFKFVATDPTMNIFLSTVSGLNHAFEIFENSCSGTSLICINNNNSGSSESLLKNNYTVGETYYIRVLNASNSLTTLGFSICVQNFTTPTNNLCTNAITLTPTPTCITTQGTFSGSSISTSAPSCASNASQDVWFKFVATDPTMNIFLSTVSGLNHAFEIFENSCSGTSLICINNNNSGSSESLLKNNYTVGETYYIRVLNASNTLTTSSFSICVQNFTTPTNDLCTNAVTLTPTPTCITTQGTFSGSSISSSAPSCASNASQDVWFKFVANNTSMTIQISSVFGLNHGFELFFESCNGANLACVNNQSSGLGEGLVYSNFILGATYYVRVFNVSNNLSLNNFNICLISTSLNNETFIDDSSFLIFPNPATTFLYIDTNIHFKSYNYTIFTIDGKEILNGKLTENKKIDIQSLIPGIYFIKVNNNSSSKRFIKI